MNGYVYVLISLKDNNKYIGSTINVRKRLNQHNQGLVMSTKNRRPLVLSHVLEYTSIEEASKMEKRFKKSHDTLKREIEKRFGV